MNIEEMVSGIAYFERLFSLAGLGQNISITPPQRLRISCPITNRRFNNVNAVRQLSLPFIVAVRNALLSRPWDFLMAENSGEMLQRYTTLIAQSGIEEIDFSSENWVIQDNWLRGHQIIEALLQRYSRGASGDLTVPIVQEYRVGMSSQTISATELPMLLSRFSNWQLSLLTGTHGNALNFNVISPQAQNDFANVNQRGLQNTTFAELSRQLEAVSRALMAMNATAENPLPENHFSQNPFVPNSSPIEPNPFTPNPNANPNIPNALMPQNPLEEMPLHFSSPQVVRQYETVSTNNGAADFSLWGEFQSGPAVEQNYGSTNSEILNTNQQTEQNEFDLRSFFDNDNWGMDAGTNSNQGSNTGWDSDLSWLNGVQMPAAASDTVINIGEEEIEANANAEPAPRRPATPAPHSRVPLPPPLPVPLLDLEATPEEPNEVSTVQPRPRSPHAIAAQAEPPMTRPVLRRSYAAVARAWMDNEDEEKEDPALGPENDEIVIGPIERREIVIPDSDHFVYQGQPRLTNLPLVGPYLPTLALPSIPLIQPYDPNSNARPDVISGTNFPHGNVRVSVAIQIPQEHADLPIGVLERLAEHNIPRERLEIFISIQDNPWENNAERLLRVHPYVHPFAEGDVDIESTVQVSLAELGRRFTPFSEHSVQTHHGVFSPQNMQVIGGLNFQRTHVLYSLCTNPRTNRMGLTLHVLLSDLNQRLILDMLEDVSLNTVQGLINGAEIINAIAEEDDQFPLMELQYLTGMQARPVIAPDTLLESQRQLAVEVRRALPTAVRLPSERRLSQEFSGQHSAGGTSTRLEAATNRAGLNFVETVLGSAFVHTLDASAAQRLNMLIQNFADYLRERLTNYLREATFLGTLDPTNYNDIANPHVYFHPDAVTIRSILHNSKIRRGYNHGILLREIAAIWYSVRNLPVEERQNYINNVAMQMHEIQRAYNIARFYQNFFYADERTPEDWIDPQNHRIFKINNARESWGRVEANIGRVRAAFINRPLREAPDPLIPDEELNREQISLRRAHLEADSRAEEFEQVRDFILNTCATHRDGTIPITLDMAGMVAETSTALTGRTDTVYRRAGRGVLENFVRIIELMNRFDHPTSAIATDNFLLDADSCGPGAETRLLDIANTLPEISLVIVSPLQATQLFQEFITAQLPQWIDEAIVANFAEVEPIQVMLRSDNPSLDERTILSQLFEPLRQRIRDTLNAEASNSPQVRVALTVRNNVSGELVVDEVTQILLEGFNIHNMGYIAQSHLTEVDFQENEPDIEAQNAPDQEAGYYYFESSDSGSDSEDEEDEEEQNDEPAAYQQHQEEPEEESQPEIDYPSEEEVVYSESGLETDIESQDEAPRRNRFRR